MQFREVGDVKVNLQSQFNALQPIQHISSYHAFIPIAETSLVMKIHCQTLSGQSVNISALIHLQNIPFCKVSGYVTGVCDSRW